MACSLNWKVWLNCWSFSAIKKMRFAEFVKSRSYSASVCGSGRGPERIATCPKAICACPGTSEDCDDLATCFLTLKRKLHLFRLATDHWTFRANRIFEVITNTNKMLLIRHRIRLSLRKHAHRCANSLHEISVDFCHGQTIARTIQNCQPGDNFFVDACSLTRLHRDHRHKNAPGWIQGPTGSGCQ